MKKSSLTQDSLVTVKQDYDKEEQQYKSPILQKSKKHTPVDKKKKGKSGKRSVTKPQSSKSKENKAKPIS